jgi:hypothetical protein
MQQPQRSFISNFNAKLINWCEIEKEYIDIADDAKEHAEHIADNSGKIAHQRTFCSLSRDEWYDKTLEQ